MPGPAPKHPSQRLGHGRKGEQWRRLPRGGRTGAAPKWPLAVPPEPAEADVWRMLWATPQAVVWDEQPATARLVARYVLHLVAVETRKPETRLLAEVRQLEQLLLLSPAALAKARMEIAADEVAEQRATHVAVVVPDDQALAKRRRLMAVDGSAVAGA